MRMRGILAILLVWTLSSAVSGFCSDLALIHAKIYPSPAGPPIENGAIFVHAGRILAVGPNATIKILPYATVIDCHGLVVTAGFWNSHVHILTPGLLHAEKLSSEQVSRFSCMKFLGVSGVFDYAGPSRNSRLSPLFMLPSAHYKDVGVRIASFRSSIAHPTYSPVYASLCTSRYPTQNSGPSGSLLLTRENLAFSASCRFIPAH